VLTLLLLDNKVYVVLAVGIPLLFLNYFLLEGLSEKKYQDSVDNFINGYDEGVRDSISSLYNNTENCNIVPIFIENKTRNLIDFSCIENESNLP